VGNRGVQAILTIDVVDVPAIKTYTMAWSSCCIVRCVLKVRVKRWYEAEVEYKANSDST
jgi:hypothetical protein